MDDQDHNHAYSLCQAINKTGFTAGEQCSRGAGYGYSHKFCWQHVPWKGASEEALLSGRISRERLVEIIVDLRQDLEVRALGERYWYPVGWAEEER